MMKKLILLLVLCTSGFVSESALAQVSVRVNISNQPIWGPVGYDYVEYYYLPDVEAYYYVRSHKYIYLENGRWQSRSNLPSRYRGYDVYNGRKVVINESRPYLRHQDYKARYSSPNDGSNPQSIRDSRDSRYFENKNHPEHSNWKATKKNQERSNRQEKGKRRQ